MADYNREISGKDQLEGEDGDQNLQKETMNIINIISEFLSMNHMYKSAVWSKGIARTQPSWYFLPCKVWLEVR